jgi:deoxyribodipyrimidine photo-lyase
MSSTPVIVWLRNELRLSDHPALHAAAVSGAAVVPLYILDEDADGPWELGGPR